MMIGAISKTAHKRVRLPYIEGHHRSVTLLHLLCSAKIDSRQGKITYDSLKDEVIERGTSQINNMPMDVVKSKWQNVEIKKAAKMMTDPNEKNNAFHETVDVKVSFLTQGAVGNDDEIDLTIMSRKLNTFCLTRAERSQKENWVLLRFCQTCCRDNKWISFWTC